MRHSKLWYHHSLVHGATRILFFTIIVSTNYKQYTLKNEERLIFLIYHKIKAMRNNFKIRLKHFPPKSVSITIFGMKLLAKILSFLWPKETTTKHCAWNKKNHLPIQLCMLYVNLYTYNNFTILMYKKGHHNNLLMGQIICSITNICFS